MAEDIKIKQNYLKSRKWLNFTHFRTEGETIATFRSASSNLDHAMIRVGDSAQVVVVAEWSPTLIIAWSRSAGGRSKRHNRFTLSSKVSKIYHFLYESWNHE